MPDLDYSLMPSVRTVVETATRNLKHRFDFPDNIVQLCEEEVWKHVPWQTWSCRESVFVDCIERTLEKHKVRNYA